jgi:acetate kinase
VFTGGVGEHCAPVREWICRCLLTLRGEDPADAGDDPARRLGATGLRVLVVPADEEGVLDRAARQLLGASVDAVPRLFASARWQDNTTDVST